MRNSAQVVCAYSGMLCMVFFLAALLVGHFLPPTDPNLTAEQTAALLLSHTTGVRLAAIFMNISCGAFMAFYAGIGSQMSRMESPNARTWATVQLMSGGLTVVPVVGTCVAWVAAVYRPERSAETIQTLNDIAWFCIVMPIAPVLWQCFAIGLGTLADKRSPPVYPRWYGFWVCWIGVVVLTGLLTPFFKTGPFTWRGLLSFWMPVAIFGLWMPVQAVLMIKAAKRLPDG